MKGTLNFSSITLPYFQLFFFSCSSLQIIFIDIASIEDRISVEIFFFPVKFEFSFNFFFFFFCNRCEMNTLDESFQLNFKF